MELYSALTLCIKGANTKMEGVVVPEIIRQRRLSRALKKKEEKKREPAKQTGVRRLDNVCDLPPRDINVSEGTLSG